MRHRPTTTTLDFRRCMSRPRSTGPPALRRASSGPRSYFGRDDVLHLVFVEGSTVVGVEPPALNGNGVGVNVGCNHLELAGAQGWQLSHQILVSPALLEEVSDLFDVLWLREPSDEGRVGLGEDLVVHVTHVLGGQDASNTVLSGLFEDQFDEVLSPVDCEGEEGGKAPLRP